MKTLVRAVVVGVIAHSFATARVAQAGINVWTSHGPSAGAIFALVIDPTTPSTLYAGTFNDGVFQSTNGGNSWRAVSTGLSGAALVVVALAIDPTAPSTLYAGTYGGGAGVFQSTNGGASWSAINTGLSSYALSVVALAIDPTTNTVYAGTDGDGVYQSTNNGASWSPANTGLSGNALFVTSLAIDASIPSTLFAGTSNGVFQTTNGGASWSAANTGLSDRALFVNALALDRTTPGTLYAGTPVGVFQSTNSGASWSAVNASLSGNALLVEALVTDPTTPGTLYCGTWGAGVFRSTDSGGSWAAINTGLSSTDLDITALAVDPTTTPSRLYAGTDAFSEAKVFDIEFSGSTVPGRGANGCVLEWSTAPAAIVGRSGLPAHQLTCADDDPACDFGATTGDRACTFHVAVCLNVLDSRLSCAPTDVAQVQLVSPRETKPKDATAMANRDALENTMTGIGGLVRGRCGDTWPHKGDLCSVNAECDATPGSGDGVCKGRFVVFLPALDADNTCTAFAPIQVPLKQTTAGTKAGSATLRIKTLSGPSASATGTNSLKLTCKPHR